LAQLAAERDLILMEDLGSGVLIDLSPFGLRDEPVVADILKAGVDLVMFSGDKLLGGPQAGIIAGRADIIAGLRKHPLLRALRIDKLSLAALEATLRLYLPPHNPLSRVPVLQALSQPLAEVEVRAQKLAASVEAMNGVTASVTPSAAYVGGGSLPQQDLESVSVVVACDALSPEALSDRLRGGPVPVVARIHQGKLWLDMRTVTDAELPDIVAALGTIAAP